MAKNDTPSEEMNYSRGISDITYDKNSSEITFYLKSDVKSGALFWAEHENQRDIEITTKVKAGSKAGNDYDEIYQQKIKKDLAIKKKNIAVDCLIDLTGEINPVLKEGKKYYL